MHPAADSQSHTLERESRKRETLTGGEGSFLRSRERERLRIDDPG